MKPEPKFKKGQAVYKVGANGVLDWERIYDLRQVGKSYVYCDVANECWHEHHLFASEIELIENELRYWNKLYEEYKDSEHVCHDFFVRNDGDVICFSCGAVYEKVTK